MARAADFEYVVTNETDRLDQTVDRLLAIVAAEKARAGRQPVRL